MGGEPCRLKQVAISVQTDVASQGGIANQCQCLEQIFSGTSHGRDEGAFFCCSRVRCRLCSEQRWLFARKKRILFPATPKSRNWENRNSGPTARFAMAWARKAEDAVRTSRARRNIMPIPPPKGFSTSTMGFRAQPSLLQRREASAWACRTEKSGRGLLTF